MINRRRVLLGGFGLASFGLVGDRSAVAALPTGRHTRAGIAFGTTVSLVLLHPKADEANAALAAGFERIRAVERAISLFDPHSDLARLNATGQLDAPDPMLVTVLRAALDLAATTDGAFDPTIQPLWRVKAEAAQRGTAPDPAAFEAARALIAHQAVECTPDRIRLLRPGMAITLNGIAQGFAADEVIRVLRERGIEAALVDTGEFGGYGSLWRVGIAEPATTNSIRDTLVLDRGFLATSSGAELRFDPSGTEHHIIDPATGHSPSHLKQVSVHAPTGMLADGLSTALMVLPLARHAVFAARYGARVFTVT